MLNFYSVKCCYNCPLQQSYFSQEQLLLEAAVSLVGNPRLESPDDPTRQQLIRVAESVAEKDPEFILKVNIPFL